MPTTVGHMLIDCIFALRAPPGREVIPHMYLFSLLGDLKLFDFDPVTEGVSASVDIEKPKAHCVSSHRRAKDLWYGREFLKVIAILKLSLILCFEKI